MLIHPRTVNDRIFEVWRSPGRFTKNPDIIQLKSGRILLVYNDSDSHGQQGYLVITLLASDDLGKTWFKFREIATADRERGDERLRTPRISRLSDERVVIICDLDDNGHFHEDQPAGNQIWWSNDQGETWNGPLNDGIMGFEPDRIIELSNGNLLVAAHLMRRESQEFAEIVTESGDGGITWRELATVAHDGYHRFCEGAIVVLHDGSTLACVIRENHGAGIPCLVAFSYDQGKTWSKPLYCPFALHRPYAKQLPDGRVLVTGRHVNGGLGTYGWVGDLEEEAGTHVIGGPRRKYAAHLDSDCLVIENKPEHECRYSLLPAESSFSAFEFEAQLRVEGPNLDPSVVLSVGSHGAMLIIGPDSISWVTGQLSRPRNVDAYQNLNFRQWRTVTITHKQGWMRILVDGETVFHKSIFGVRLQISDTGSGDPSRRTQFGQAGDSGRSFWESVSWKVENPTLDDHAWSWEAASGEFPDQYQRDRLIQIHGNNPNPSPDHGYSSWLRLDDGRILLVDYTNVGDVPPTCHLVGVYLTDDDLA